MREQRFILTESRELTDRVRLLRLEGNSPEIVDPGQFVMLEVPNRFLRRPFSVCDWDEGWLTVLIERTGDGTAALQDLSCGSEISVLSGLGHGFTVCGHQPLLIGGGTGLSPLVGLYRRLRAAGQAPSVLLGFREPGDAFGVELFPDAEVTVTDDVFTVLDNISHDCFYACGSESMMEALCHREAVPGQVAFDVRMGCGFGACMGCSRKTTGGMKRVCKDGPVFRKEELVWVD